MPRVTWASPSRLHRHEDIFEENFWQGWQVRNSLHLFISFNIYVSLLSTGWREQTRIDWELNLKTWLRSINTHWNKNQISKWSNFKNIFHHPRWSFIEDCKMIIYPSNLILDSWTNAIYFFSVPVKFCWLNILNFALICNV